MGYLAKSTQILASALLVGCATNGGNFAAVFTSPKSLEGQTVTQCGFLQYEFENVNFYPNRRQAKKGESGVGVSPGNISDSELSNHHNQTVCLTGQVRYAGCSVTMICTGSNFLYEIIVDDLKVR